VLTLSTACAKFPDSFLLKNGLFMDSATKQNLLKVTRNLIDTMGVGAISMRVVGRNSGLSRTASYRHFKNKQSLLAAIVVEDFEMLSSTFLELQNKSIHPKQLLAKLLKSYHDFAMKNPEHYQLMFNTEWNKEKFPEIATIAFSVFQKTEEYVNNALKASDSKLHATKEATAILYSFIHGLVELNLIGHRENSKGLGNPKLLIDRFIDSVF
jgi:AcrR family transcriptional regulator